MEQFRLTMVIAGCVIASTFATALIFNNNDNDINIDLVNSLQVSVSSNEKNILQIKALLQDIKNNDVEPNMNSVDISEITQQTQKNNIGIEQLTNSFDYLSNSFLALNKKQEAIVKLLADKTGNTSNEQETMAMPRLPLPPKAGLQGNIATPQELQWDTTDLGDNIATTEIQDKLASAFSTENNGNSDVSVSNVECRTDICKVALEYSNDLKISPVMQLMQQGGFEGREISMKESQEGDRTSMTIFITKVEDGGGMEGNSFSESIPQN